MPPHSLDVILVLTLQANFDQVLAVNRKFIANCDSAAGSERQVFTLPLVLEDVERDLESIHLRACWRESCCEPRYLPRDREVTLQMRRGDGERVRKIIEAAVGRFVSRKLRSHIEIHGEQVANRIAVLRAIEAVNSTDTARIGTCRPGAIDLIFQPGCDGAIRCRVRPRSSRRR